METLHCRVCGGSLQSTRNVDGHWYFCNLWLRSCRQLGDVARLGRVGDSWASFTGCPPSDVGALLIVCFPGHQREAGDRPVTEAGWIP